VSFFASPLFGLVGLLLPAMVEIPAGDYQPFLNQAPGIASPVVPLTRFSLDERPVTQRDFLAFVTAHPQWRKSKVKRVFAETGYLKNWPDDLHGPASPRSPVTFVSWFAANAYCKAQGARLPTTDQWEYAATVGGRASAEVSARTLAWYGKPTQTLLPDVGGAVNAFGVADMIGLVWEWTLDFSSVMISDDQRSGGEGSPGLYCGGGGASGRDPSDYASFMRFAFRSSLTPTFTIANLGFRCARSVSP